jgi:organic radical activating enzyme
MRGKAQNKDLDLAKFDAFLDNVESIGTLTFTGGEPSLNTPAIKHILQSCKDKHVYVSSFYIVTNGKCVPDEFYQTILEWYSHIVETGGDTDLCSVALSRDNFHEELLDDEAINKLKAFRFFYEDDKNTDWDRARLTNLGNARSLTAYNKQDPSYSTPDVTLNGNTLCINDCVIAFTCDGDILADCDYEYESTDNIKICDHLHAVDEFYKMATDPEYECAV